MARRSGSTPPAGSPPSARRSPLTGRAVVLVLVVAALVVSSVVPLRVYFQQRAELDALRDQTAQQEERVAALRAQKARWKDPAYVEAQARQRLHFTMPGEVGYVVLEPDEAPVSEPTRPTTRPDQPWYAALLGSIEAADEAPVGADGPDGVGGAEQGGTEGEDERGAE